MKIFILISWRNLWRHKNRSLVVIFSISIGILAMIFSMSFMNGINQQMIENTINTSLGHIAIHRKGFQDTLKLKYNFSADNKLHKILSEAKETKKITAYAPRVKLQAMVRSAEASQGIMVIGIEPEKEKQVSMLETYTDKNNNSQFLEKNDKNSVLISKTLAKKLDLRIGEKMTLMIQKEKTTNHQEDDIIGIGLKVKGVYQTPVESFDKYIIFTNISLLQATANLKKNISEITILLKDKKDVDNIKNSLIKKINNQALEILSWKDMAPNLVSAVKTFDQMMYVFFMIIFITVIFSIANTLIMAIMERFHEIGVMKSIGTRPGKIFFMIMFEAINLGIIGLIIGLGAGILLNSGLSYTGINLSFYMESMRAWGSGSIIYPMVKLMDIFVAIVIVLSVTILAALYPAIKAARIKPLEAVNFI